MITYTRSSLQQESLADRNEFVKNGSCLRILLRSQCKGRGTSCQALVGRPCLQLSPGILSNAHTLKLARHGDEMRSSKARELYLGSAQMPEPALQRSIGPTAPVQQDHGMVGTGLRDNEEHNCIESDWT